jgi:hypothetical protein
MVKKIEVGHILFGQIRPRIYSNNADECPEAGF